MKKLFLGFIAIAAALMTSCSSDDPTIKVYGINIFEITPGGLPSDYTVIESTLKLTELNTNTVTTLDLLASNYQEIPAGTYNIEGKRVITYDNGGTQVTKELRCVHQQVVIHDESPKTIQLSWFFYNPDASLVISHIYVIGTLNATGKAGLYDSFFRIYNNTDETIYADGLALCESQMSNTSTNQIKTPEALPEANFTAQTIYVIPGNGTDVPVAPGQSIKIVDQAINWSEQVPGAMDHTDADFEWYDEVNTGTVRDTDNPSVPNLDKWFSYSNTIWIANQQCIKSYALVRFPAGMTAQQFLASYDGQYTYVNAVTGNEMTASKCYRIPNEWIIDGVNLCPNETYTFSSLAPSVDLSYAAISEKKADNTVRGLMFERKKAGTSAAGNTILQDTNDSAADFKITAAKAN